MGLRKIAAKKKAPKTVRISKAGLAVMNHKSVGDEPQWETGHIPTNAEKGMAFNWYAVCGEVEHARSFLTEYFVRRKETKTAELLEGVPNTCFPRTASWLARMDELGADVSSSEKFIRESAANAINTWGEPISKNEEIIEESTKVTPADLKLDSFIANLEDVIDSRDWKFNTYDALKGNNFPTSRVGAISEYYSPILDEIRVAIANTDLQVYEGYSCYTKKELKEQESWMSTLIDDCRKFSKSERVAKPRKKKTVSAEKILKHFVYLKESQQFKAASVNPENIIGAKKVYLFNIKYKSMTMLIGESLTVKGKSIIGHNESSWTVPMGRKAEEAVFAVTQGNEAAVTRKLAELCKGKKPNERVKNSVDNNTLVLRTVGA